MLGFYDYTVWLTYLSLISAGTGIMVSLNGTGHPYLGVFFLLVCGLCDAFDGKVARSKKNRTKMEKSFGVQIDSLSDLVAFGVLPACIGNAMIRVLPTLPEAVRLHSANKMMEFPYIILCYGIMLFYMLAALIRLAYFNVTEEERQKTEDGVRKYYEGLPVTSAALIFPTMLLLQYLIPMDITPFYFGVMILTAFAFVSKLAIRKPGMKMILGMIAIGAVEFILLAVSWMF